MTAADGLGASIASRMEDILDRRASPLVGVAVGVCRGDRIATIARGRLGPRREAPDERSIFEIGSITKVFTATVLACMAETGEVALDDPVNRHLPEHARLPVRGRPITLADLATHTSGLPRLPRGLVRLSFPRHRANPYAPFTVAHLEHATATTRLRRAPGGRPRYSNFGAGLLGHVLALRAGCDYETLVRARVCEPLGLADTRVHVPDADRARFADGHNRRGRPAAHWDAPALAGAGALRSTVADLLRFLQAQWAGGDNALARAIRATHVPRARQLAVEQCLGWMAVERRGVRGLWHSGGTGGFRTFAGFTPATRCGAVVLANTARSVDAIGIDLIDALAAPGDAAV
jgi:CubicO group peptidase (beta-lactamase class C family)